MALFGQQVAGTRLGGTTFPAATTPSIFGTATPSIAGTLAPAANPFGSTALQTVGQPLGTVSTLGQPATGSIFGAPAATPAIGSTLGGSLVGLGSSQLGQPTPNLFGSSVAGSLSQPVPGLGAAGGQQNQMLRAGGNRHEPGVSPQVAFEEIFQAYNPQSPYCRFRWIFYNSVEPGTARNYAKPPSASAVLWQHALENNPNPENLVPAQATGFGELQQRVQAQRERATVHVNALKGIKQGVDKLGRKQAESLRKLEEYREKHIQLLHSMNRAMRKLEVVQGKRIPLTDSEIALRSRSERLYDELTQPSQYSSRLAEVASLVHVREGKSPSPDSTSLELTSPIVQSVRMFLENMQAGIEQLTAVLGRDARDLEIMRRGLNQPRGKL